MPHFEIGVSLINGVIAGAHTFVAVDCSTLQTLIDKKEAEAVSNYFQIWWPKGAILMAPLMLTGLVSNGTAYFYTRNLYSLVGAGCHLASFCVTAFWMKSPISRLMADQNEKDAQFKSFTRLHYLRMGLAYSAVAASSLLLNSLYSR